jgi:hypothetical protein
MLKLDWALVDKKVNELYPRFKKGMKYAEIEQELGAEGIDKETIDFIIGELDQKLLEKRHAGDSTGIMILSFVSVIVFAVVLGIYYRNGFVLFSVGMVSAVFMFFKVFGQWLSERGK